MQCFYIRLFPIQEIVLLELYHYSVLLQCHISADSPNADQPHFYEPLPPTLRESTFSSIEAFRMQFFSVARKLIVMLPLSCTLLCSNVEVTKR